MAKTTSTGSAASWVAPASGAPADPETKADVHASARSGYVAWGVIGFLFGAIFWHVVGFWDFLGGIFYKRQQEATVFERVLTLGQMMADEDRPLAEHERRARQAAQNCTTLVVDRFVGRTASRPCVVVIRKVPEDAEAGVAAVRAPLEKLDKLAINR